MTHYNVGKIVNTHGIRGELKIVSSTDFPESRFRKGSVLDLFKDENSTQPLRTLTIKSAKKQKNVYLIQFEGFNNINDVEQFKGMVLKISEANLDEDELEEGQYYYHEIIGLKVVDETGQLIGTISDILALGPNDVWTVKREKQSDLLLPVIKQVVKDVDLEKGQVTVELMEGLD
ncbi:ribosome maturation protein RimM [Secundilactobacillus oryzae JCM 18671]|uniref:Ribosome maturation factor RimM n=1 Tax=Secundilactobacillus oryzae JCM 18671 TaxID=1291743 RepID=A0A081BIM8_9LACO|nr:ribosome maturation factor RimM [Secundilactobacillus oryzae]GAK47896.1 ribosome maturation protein RimM [Secundilactobacillus oryzae JCM 18671]